MLRYVEGAYLALHVLAVEICLHLARRFVAAEADVDVIDSSLQTLRVQTAVLAEHSATHSSKSDGAIHGAGVNVYVAHHLGKVFRHRALATRRVAVDGYRYFLHSYIK